MSASRALITGATGMIGAALAARLLTLGWEVCAFTRAGSSTDRQADILDDIRLRVVNWNDSVDVSAAVEWAEPTCTFHPAGPPFNPPLPLAHYMEAVTNAAALISALEVSANPCPLVYASSAAVYGREVVASETAALNPTTWLSASKAMQGILFAASGRLTGRNVVELRLFTPFGPADRPERLIPSLIAAALENRQVPLTSGEQERDFLYIDDVIDAFVAAAAYRHSEPTAFNVGSGTPTKVRDLALLLLTVLGCPGLADFGAIPTRPDEITRMSADIGAAGRLLHWTPRTPLSLGLQKTIDWYRQQ